MNYKTKSGKKYSNFDIQSLCVKILKEKRYLTAGLVSKKIGINFYAAQKHLFEMESDTGIIKRQRFDTGSKFISIWFKSKPEEISDD